MKTKDEQMDSVSTMLAAAYWRGVLNQSVTCADPVVVEAMIKAAAEKDAANWRPSAKIALT